MTSLVAKSVKITLDCAPAGQREREAEAGFHGLMPTVAADLSTAWSI